MPKRRRTLRVLHGQCVYMLECRLAAIAKRKFPGSTQLYAQCLEQLRSFETNNVTFLVITHWHSRVSGIITVVSPRGIRYKVHHTDVIRV